MNWWKGLLGAVSRAGTAMIVRSAAQALLLIMLARELGSSIFGGWIAVTSLALMVGMLASMGMGYLVLLRSGQGFARGRMALTMGLPSTLWCGLPLLFLYLFVANVLFGQKLSTAILLLVGGAEILVAPPTLLLALRLQGCGHAGSAQALYVVPPALRLLLLLLAASAGYPLAVEGFALWYGASAVFAGVLAWYLCRRHDLLPRRWRWRPSRPHLHAGLIYLPTRICAFGATEIDKVLAPLVLTSILAGSYALASRAAGFVLLPIHAVLAAVQPQLAAMARTDRKRFMYTSRVGLLMAAGYGVFSAVIVAVLAAPLIGWLAGGQYPDLTEAFHALALALVPMVLRHAVGGVLLPLGKPLLRVGGELLGMAVLCVSMPLLAGLGLLGIGVAMLLSEFLALCVLSAGLLHGFKEAGNAR